MIVEANTFTWADVAVIKDAAMVFDPAMVPYMVVPETLVPEILVPEIVPAEMVLDPAIAPYSVVPAIELAVTVFDPITDP